VKPLTMTLALLAVVFCIWRILPRCRMSVVLLDETDTMGDYGAYPVSRRLAHIH